jgi:hypothetical protein
MYGIVILGEFRMNELCSLIAKMIKVWLIGVAVMMLYGIVMTISHLGERRESLKSDQLGEYSSYDRTARR